MNQELSTTPSTNETLLRLVIALVISGAVVWVMAVAGSNAEARSNDFFMEENGSTSVIIVEPGLMAAEAKTAFSGSQYRYVRCNSSGFRRRTSHTFGRNPVRLMASAQPLELCSL